MIDRVAGDVRSGSDQHHSDIDRGRSKSTEGATCWDMAWHNAEMKNIPGGKFYMGTPKHLVHFPQDGEGPVRQVKMSSFAIDTYEVSNDKFAEFVESEEYATEAEEYGDSFVAELWLSKAVSDTIDQAVAAVPWWLPVKGCSWRNPEGFDTSFVEDTVRSKAVYECRDYLEELYVKRHQA